MNENAGNGPGVRDDRMATGIEGLDLVLGGGILHGHSLLLKGAPGSAKTTLGVQILVNGARQFGERGILLSFEQSPAQLIHDTAEFGWNLRGLREEGWIHTLALGPEDLYRSLTSEESPLVREIRDVVSQRQARRILVDGASNFFRTHRPTEEQDQAFLEFLSALKELGLTAVLTAEEESLASRKILRPEYVADAVIRLRFEPDTPGGRPTRWLEVSKTRGQAFLEGRHPFRIGTDGIVVFPRVYPEPLSLEEGMEAGVEICSIGVKGLDTMLGGGLRRGSLAIIAGMEGAGKTTVGAHFLEAGLGRGEPALMMTFQEGPGQILESMAARGIGLHEHVKSGRLRILHLPPIGLSMLETYYEVRSIIAREGVRRLVVDSLNDVRRESGDEEERRYSWMLFADLCRRGGVTAVLLEQTRHAQGLETLAQIEHASLVDTIIYMGFAEIDGRLAKIVSVLKSRHAIADDRIRELVMSARGAEVLNGLRGLSGILDGAPVRSTGAGQQAALRLARELRDSLGEAASGGVANAAACAALRDGLSDLTSLLEASSPSSLDAPTT